MAEQNWNGAEYDRISGPLERNGLTVLDRLELGGEETVIDAGCGSGRVTQTLVRRLPRGRVVGVDRSPGMLDAARSRLGGRAELILSDLTELDIAPRRVDAVFSTAVFHWIADHDRLFARLRRALRPGGRLVAQCGGEGNTPELLDATLAVAERAPYDAYLAGWSPWNYQAPRATARRLRAARFTEVRTRLVESPPPYEDLRAWLLTNALNAHLVRLPADLRDPYVEAVHEQMGAGASVTYVRLDIDAVAA